MNHPASQTMAANKFEVRILRQDHFDDPSYWQTFRLDRQPSMNVTSILQRIAANPTTTSGAHVSPVAYDSNCLEEVCGSCTMLINGRVRQACSALVDQLLGDNSGRIELRPMSKFPVIRDLMVDRRRLFRALEKLHAWIPVDGYHNVGPGPRQPNDVLVGGGNVNKLKELPRGCRAGDNANAFLGGFRMWEHASGRNPSAGIPSLTRLPALKALESHQQDVEL